MAPGSILAIYGEASRNPILSASPFVLIPCYAAVIAVTRALREESDVWDNQTRLARMEMVRVSGGQTVQVSVGLEDLLTACEQLLERLPITEQRSSSVGQLMEARLVSKSLLGPNDPKSTSLRLEISSHASSGLWIPTVEARFTIYIPPSPN